MKNTTLDAENLQRRRAQISRTGSLTIMLMLAFSLLDMWTFQQHGTNGIPRVSVAWAQVAASPVSGNAGNAPLITNTFAETDIRQALSDIAVQAGVTIIPDNTVQGAVTADLKNVPLEHAIAMVLQSGGYAYAKLDGYYLVGAPEPSNPNYYLFCTTEIVTLKHISAEQILALLLPLHGRYLSIEGSTPAPLASTERDNGRTARMAKPRTVPDRQGNEHYRIIITAPLTMLPRIKSDIALLDRVVPQIMLEAAIIEVSSDALSNVSLDWATKWLRQDFASGGPNLVYSTIANTEIVQLTALVQQGKARLRANPRIATLEGQTAELEVGKENYFAILTGPATYPYTTLEKITSGILLRITPRVLMEEREIVTEIEPEVRDVTGKGVNGLPEITFRRAMTNLRVKDGQSIVIGGLVNEGESRTISKVPVLGDIPLLKYLFRQRNTSNTKSEVVIIVTPHIVTDWAQAQNLVEHDTHPPLPAPSSAGRVRENNTGILPAVRH